MRQRGHRGSRVVRVGFLVGAGSDEGGSGLFHGLFDAIVQLIESTDKEEEVRHRIFNRFTDLPSIHGLSGSSSGLMGSQGSGLLVVGDESGERCVC